MEVFRKNGGDHPVVLAVGDERGLGDLSTGRPVRPRPHFLIAVSCVCKALVLIGASRSTVRSSSRFTNAFAARLPVMLRLKKRNSFGSERVRVARRMS